MIKKIAVIGTGVIGSGWIIRFLAHDKEVIAYDKNKGLKKKNNFRNQTNLALRKKTF